MNTTAFLDNGEMLTVERPGSQLAMIRVNKGLSAEYIAEKLRLRVQLLEWLEIDEYSRLPESVFVKGYLRAYAKLMDVPPEPFIQAYLSLSCDEPGINKPVWKSMQLPKERKKFGLLKGLIVFILIAAGISFLWNQYHHDLIVSVLQTEQDTAIEPIQQDTQTILPQVDKMKSFFRAIPLSETSGSPS